MKTDNPDTPGPNQTSDSASSSAEIRRSGPPALMGGYVREYSVIGLLAASCRLYFSGFGPLLLAYLIPVLPILVVINLKEASEPDDVPVWLYGLFYVLSFIALASITLIVSAICLRHKPTVIGSYRRLLGKRLLRILWTSVLVTLVVGIAIAVALIGSIISAAPRWGPVAGILSLVSLVIGMIVFVRTLLASVVATLEHRWGRDAMHRSASLSKGFRLRNALIVLIFFALGAVGPALSADIWEHDVIKPLLLTLVQCVMSPLSLIALVLMYYDLRVRKEDYDEENLAEDLAR